MYPECFNGTVGCFDDHTYHITLDPEVSPVVHAPRKVPIELKDKLQAELHEMESQDIIAKVTQPTDWVNSLVIREKENGRLRLCLDPTGCRCCTYVCVRVHVCCVTISIIKCYIRNCKQTSLGVALACCQEQKSAF